MGQDAAFAARLTYMFRVLGHVVQPAGTWSGKVRVSVGAMTRLGLLVERPEGYHNRVKEVRSGKCREGVVNVKSAY